jgi:hypothetical protein
MAEIEQEFLDLFLDDGALTRLSETTENIRILLSASGQITDKQKERLEHSGVAGEYIHGIGFVHQLMKSHKSAPELEPIKNILTKLANNFEKPSQLSNSPPHISEEFHKNENCFDAIPRAVKDTKEWAETADLSLSEKANLAALLTECSEQYTIVRAFAERIRDMSPS